MKILIATGASGGHVFPALSVAEELRSAGQDIMFVATEGAMAERIRQRGFPLRTVSAKGVSFATMLSSCRSIGWMIIAIGQSISLLRVFRPDYVVGFGGYGAFPVVLMAVVFRYPTLIHEQNVLPGRANRILSTFVRRIAVTFEESREYFPSLKTVLTGYPQHLAVPKASKKDLLKKFNLSADSFTILILGGSQGSQRINRAFLETIPLLKKELNFQVIHIIGERDDEQIKSEYRNAGICCCLFRFLDTMADAYHVSDVVIARSGAGVVSEIAMFGLPAILIPYPHAGGHQRENAKILSDGGAAVLIDERGLLAQKLKDEILKISKNPNAKEIAFTKLNTVYIPDAAKRLAEEILRLKK